MGDMRICILGTNANQRAKIEMDLSRLFELREKPITAGHENFERVCRGLREPLLIVHEGNMDHELAVMLHIGMRFAFALKIRQP